MFSSTFPSVSLSSSSDETFTQIIPEEEEEGAASGEQTWNLSTLQAINTTKAPTEMCVRRT